MAEPPSRPDAATLTRAMRIGFVALVLVVVALMAWGTLDMRRAARLFPQYLAGVTIALCLVELARQALRRLRPTAESTLNTADIGVDAADSGLDGFLRGLAMFGWIAGYGLMIGVLGAPVATVLFVPLLMHGRFRSDWRATLGLVAGLLVLMYLLRTVLGLRLPPGLLGLF